jgi:hypothetical protein
MRRVPALTALAVLVAASGAQAVPPKIALRPAITGALVQGGWQPVTVTVTNPTDGEALSGEVRLELTEPRLHRSLGTFTKDVHLPAGASETAVSLLVHVPKNALPVAQVRVSAQGDTRAARTFENLPVQSGESLRVLCVTNRPGYLDSLNGTRIGLRRQDGGFVVASDVPTKNGDRSKQSMPLAVSYIAPEALPTDPAALDTISFVVSDGAEEALSTAQKQALNGFHASGGYITNNDFATRLRALYALYEGHTPRTVRALSDSAHVTHFGESDSRADTLFDTVVQGAGLEPPPFSGVLLFLALYLIAVVPLQYVVLKRLDRREWAWGTTPALALLFAVGAYGFGRSSKNVARYHNIATVVEADAGNASGSAIAAVGVYSPDRSAIDVKVDLPGSTLWSPTIGLSAGDDLLVDQTDGSMVGRGAQIPMWAMRVFAARVDGVSLGRGVTADLHWQDAAHTRVAGIVTNNTGRVLKDVILAFAGHSARIGTLPTGAPVRISALVIQGESYDTYPTDRFSAAYLQHSVVSLAVSGQVPMGNVSVERTPAVLIGTQADSPIPVTIVPGSRVAETRTTVVIHTPIEGRVGP